MLHRKFALRRHGHRIIFFSLYYILHNIRISVHYTQSIIMFSENDFVILFVLARKRP